MLECLHYILIQALHLAEVFLLKLKDGINTRSNLTLLKKKAICLMFINHCTVILAKATFSECIRIFIHKNFIVTFAQRSVNIKGKKDLLQLCCSKVTFFVSFLILVHFGEISFKKLTLCVTGTVDSIGEDWYRLASCTSV